MEEIQLLQSVSPSRLQAELQRSAWPKIRSPCASTGRARKSVALSNDCDQRRGPCPDIIEVSRFSLEKLQLDQCPVAGGSGWRASDQGSSAFREASARGGRSLPQGKLYAESETRGRRRNERRRRGC